MLTVFLLSSSGIIGIVIAVVILLLVIWLIIVRNKLVVLRNKVRNAWSQIDVQLKRRFDLIPNLVETVKGYAAHEKEIFDQFGRARNMYAQAAQTGDVAGLAEANNQIERALGRLLMVQEAYPELKANVNFQSLMNQLNETENKISFSRTFYNDIVLNYNNQIEIFPTNIVASLFNFKPAQFFEIQEVERENVKVKF
ncbi:MAG TPA: LemA family protein [Bacilli bacterium]|nr:LemA family protein [Bacilli bacterium]